MVYTDPHDMQRSMSKAAGGLSAIIARDGVEIGGREKRRGDEIVVNAGYMRNKLFPSGDAVYATPLNKARMARQAAIEEKAGALVAERESTANAASTRVASALAALAKSGTGVSVALPKGRSEVNKFGVAQALQGKLGLDGGDAALLVDVVVLPKQKLGHGKVLIREYYLQWG